MAIGFDPTGRYVLTVSHSGRGVFDKLTWKRVARDSSVDYPADGESIGIGPLARQHLKVSEIDYDNGTLDVVAPSGEYMLSYYYSVRSISV